MRSSTGGALIAVVVSASAALADITGPARVVDGDTLWIGGVKIRLADIDAAERARAVGDTVHPAVAMAASAVKCPPVQ